MKYKVTLKNKVYEVEVEQGEAMLVDEYDAVAPVPAAAPVAENAQAAPQEVPFPETPEGGESTDDLPF